MSLITYWTILPTNTYAQDARKVLRLPAEFFTESNCPIQVEAFRVELDLDPFGAPFDARIYIDYKNIVNKPITAVKFRTRFIDAYGKDRGTFHAPDNVLISMGQTRSQKWKLEHVDPRATSFKIRVLQVQFADQSIWQSSKMHEIATPKETPTLPNLLSE